MPGSVLAGLPSPQVPSPALWWSQGLGDRSATNAPPHHPSFLPLAPTSPGRAMCSEDPLGAYPELFWECTVIRTHDIAEGRRVSPPSGSAAARESERPTRRERVARNKLHLSSSPPRGG